MTKNFYTNVQSVGGKILYRGIRGGKKVKLKIDYEPKLYLAATKTPTHKYIPTASKTMALTVDFLQVFHAALRKPATRELQ